MRTAGKRIIYAAIGIVATLLGIIGIFLPGIPTVPFILVALWAFSNSSQRLHRWVSRLPVLKEAHKEIGAFQRERSISLYAKIISQVMSWLSFIMSMIVLRNFWISAAIGIAALTCTIFMWCMPTRMREVVQSSESQKT